MTVDDFFRFDPEFSDEQRRQCERIVDSVRAINDRALRLGGSLEALTSVADRAEEFLASIDEVSGGRAIESYRARFHLDSPNDVLPFNPATGELNPIAPKIDMRVEGETIVAECTFAPCHEGGPETAHGGIVAAVYDHVLAYATMRRGFTGPTLWLKVNYLKPTPVGRAIRFETGVESVDGRKLLVSGACWDGETKVSEGEALMLGLHEVPVVGGDSDDTRAGAGAGSGAGAADEG